MRWRVHYTPVYCPIKFKIEEVVILGGGSRRGKILVTNTLHFVHSSAFITQNLLLFEQAVGKGDEELVVLREHLLGKRIRLTHQSIYFGLRDHAQNCNGALMCSDTDD